MATTTTQQRRMKRASYREAIEYIAWNDEPSEREPEVLLGYPTVQLVATIFRVEDTRVARDVIRIRERDGY